MPTTGMPQASRLFSQIGLFSSCLPGWSGERILAAAAALEFPGVEWGIGPGEALEDAGSARRVTDLCGAAGPTLVGLSVQDPQVNLASRQRAATYVKLAIAIGVPHVRFFAAPYRGGRLSTLQQRHRRTLDALVDLAAPAGVKVIVETSSDTLAPTPELAVALVAHQPPELAGVLYDPGNMTIEGHVAPALAIEILGRHLAHVHVKNISWSRTGGSWRWKYAGLAGGLLDWAEIFGLLISSGYRGRYSIDHLGGGRATMALLEREATVMSDLLGQGGAVR